MSYPYGDFRTNYLDLGSNDYGSPEDYSYGGDNGVNREELLKWLEEKYRGAGMTDVGATGINAVGNLLGTLFGQPYKEVQPSTAATAREKVQLDQLRGLENSDREGKDLTYKKALMKQQMELQTGAQGLDRSRQELEARRQAETVREFDRKHPTGEAPLDQGSMERMLGWGHELGDFTPGTTMKEFGLSKEQAKRLFDYAYEHFRAKAPAEMKKPFSQADAPPLDVQPGSYEMPQQGGLPGLQAASQGGEDPYGLSPTYENAQKLPGGPLGILGQFLEEQKYGAAPPSAKKKQADDLKVQRQRQVLEQGERKAEREASAPPKTDQDWRKGMNLIRDQANHAVSAAEILAAIPPGEDVPGAGFRQYLGDQATKIGGMAGTAIGAGVGAAAGGLGFLPGAAIGGGVGAATGALASGVGETFTSPEGLRLQRELQGVANPQLYERSGAQINEQEMVRLMRELGINYKDPNADFLIRDSMPKVLNMIEGKLRSLIAMNPEAASFVGEHGGESPMELLQKVQEAQRKLAQNVPSAQQGAGIEPDSVNVTGPDGQQWRVHKGGGSGSW